MVLKRFLAGLHSKKTSRQKSFESRCFYSEDGDARKEGEDGEEAAAWTQVNVLWLKIKKLTVGGGRSLTTDTNVKIPKRE